MSLVRTLNCLLCWGKNYNSLFFLISSLSKRLFPLPAPSAVEGGDGAVSVGQSLLVSHRHHLVAVDRDQQRRVAVPRVVARAALVVTPSCALTRLTRRLQ
jgi:hypothetical protein